MQITQGASLDTLQLLSSREALQAFKVGQIIKVSVIEGTPPEQGGGRALLEIAGRQHEVRSLTPLKTGQKLQARLQAVGNRVLLQPVADNNRAASPENQTVSLDRILPAALRNLLPRQAPLQATVELARAIRQHADFPRLPEALQKAVLRLLEERPASPAPSARTLRAAIEQAGLFLEARLARPDTSGNERVNADLKGQLFQLLQQLSRLGIPLEKGRDWPKLLQPALPQPVNMAPTPVMQAEMLPVRFQAENGDPPLESLLRLLFQQADGALAKTTLQQLQQLSRPSGNLQVELPWITPWGTLPVLLEVEEQGENAADSNGPSATRFSMRLALNLPRLGAIQALAELTNNGLELEFWCESALAHGLFQQHQSRLEQRIGQLGLNLTRLEYRATPIMTISPQQHSVNTALLDMKA